MTLRIRRKALQPLIKRPLDRTLSNTQITRRQSLIETSYPFLSENLRNYSQAPRRPTRSGVRTRPLAHKLHARLDDPDWVGDGAGDDTRQRSCAEVHVRVFFPVIERVGDDVLAVPICEEVHRTRWDDPDESRSKTFEESSGGLVLVCVPVLKKRVLSDIDERKRRGYGVPKDMTRLDKVVKEPTWSSWHEHSRTRAPFSSTNHTIASVFFAKQVRLQTRPDHVKRSCYNGAAHASKSIQVNMIRSFRGKWMSE